MDEEQERLLRNFLLVRKSTRPAQQRLVKGHFEHGRRKELIETGRGEYPLEFVHYLHILLPDTLLQEIYLEVVEARKEQRERAGVLVSTLNLRDQEFAELDVEEYISHRKLEQELGVLERTAHGLNSRALQAWCHAQSTATRIYSHLHTHLATDDFHPSRADKVAYQLGNLAFVAAILDDLGLALVPYRMDSRAYDERKDFDYTHFRDISLAVLCDHPEAHDYSILNDFQQLIERGIAGGG